MYAYIKEDEDIECTNIITKIKKLFNIVTIEKIDELHYLYIIPKVKNAKIIEKTIKKIDNKEIILSKKLKKYSKCLKVENKNNKTKYYIYEILKYIINKSNLNMELQKVYILVNEYNIENVQLVKFLVDKVKTVNIITNNIKKYNKLEEQLYKDMGALIVVTNNKTKALTKAKIIINLDLKNEEINKYKINKNSIFINSTIEKIEIPYFQGIIINNIDIFIDKKKKYDILYEAFDKKDIYDSFEIRKEKDITKINKEIQENIKVVNLIGKNGIICKKEIINISKNLDKL